MNRQEVKQLLERMHEWIEGDVVTQEDDQALEALQFLWLYVDDHMTDEDFAPDAPIWTGFKEDE